MSNCLHFVTLYAGTPSVAGLAFWHVNEVKTHASAAQSRLHCSTQGLYWSSENNSLGPTKFYVVLSLTAPGTTQLILRRAFESSCLCAAPCALGRSGDALAGPQGVQKEGRLPWLSPKCPLAQHLVPGGGRSWLNCPWLQPSWLGQYQEEEAFQEESQVLHGSCLLLCPVLPGLSPSGQYPLAPGVPSGWRGLRWRVCCCSVLPSGLCHSTFGSYGSIFFFIFWSGPSVSSLISVRQLYSFHKSHYNWCQATAWPCSSCADLQARESRDGDFTPVQGVHPGKHQVYNLLSCIFPKLRSRAWITNRRDIRRALSKLAY